MLCINIMKILWLRLTVWSLIIRIKLYVFQGVLISAKVTKNPSEAIFIHLSVFYSTYPLRISQSQLTSGDKQGTWWTGRQSIARLLKAIFKKKNTHNFALFTCVLYSIKRVLSPASLFRPADSASHGKGSCNQCGWCLGWCYIWVLCPLLSLALLNRISNWTPQMVKVIYEYWCLCSIILIGCGVFNHVCGDVPTTRSHKKGIRMVQIYGHVKIDAISTDISELVRPSGSQANTWYWEPPP